MATLCEDTVANMTHYRLNKEIICNIVSSGDNILTKMGIYMNKIMVFRQREIFVNNHMSRLDLNIASYCLPHKNFKSTVLNHKVF